MEEQMTGSCKKLALWVAGVIFLLVSVAHFLRYSKAWVIVMNGFIVPVEWSLYAGIVTLILALFMLLSARK